MEACNATTWDADELRGQCFGLGARRTISNDAVTISNEAVTIRTEAASDCRDACCADPSCETWQWRADKGCFFGGGVGQCDKANSASLEPFQGRRKAVPTRRYAPPVFGVASNKTIA